MIRPNPIVGGPHREGRPYALPPHPLFVKNIMNQHRYKNQKTPEMFGAFLNSRNFKGDIPLPFREATS